jgi:hypothetical protein
MVGGAFALLKGVTFAVDVSIYTEADNVTELRRQIRDAVRCHFEPAKLPKMIRLHFVHDEVLAA